MFQSHVLKEDEVRIGVVGAGIIGAAHARRLADNDRVEAVVITNRTPDKATRLAGSLAKSEWVPEPDFLTAGLDGVVVATNTASHAEWILRAVRAGLPVFCEKPVAIDVAATQSVIQEIDRCTGAAVQIGFQRRFDSGYLRARELFRRGTFGAVHTLRATTMDEAPPPEPYIRSGLSGGLFKDCSIHDFDVISWILGARARTVFAVGTNKGERFFAESDDVDSCSAVVVYEDDTVATVSASRNSGAGHDVRLEIFGTLSGGVVGLDDRLPANSLEHSVSWLQREPYHSYAERFEGAFRRELDAFLEVAAGLAESPCTAHDALEALYVAEACTISAKAGTPIEVDDVRHGTTH